MILYLETSALVKLVRVEPGSVAVWEASERAQALASSNLARIEVHSAFARLRREGLPDAAVRGFLAEFERLWSAMAQIQMDRAEDAACGLCLKHSLRTLDAIHLASALLLREEGGLEVVFACADGRLREAAAAEGFRLA